MKRRSYSRNCTYYIEGLLNCYEMKEFVQFRSCKAQCVIVSLSLYYEQHERSCAWKPPGLGFMYFLCVDSPFPALCTFSCCWFCVTLLHASIILCWNHNIRKFESLMQISSPCCLEKFPVVRRTYAGAGVSKIRGVSANYQAGQAEFTVDQINAS